MARHHVSRGIYNPDRREAIRVGLLNRKTLGKKVSGPRWGYVDDFTAELNADGKALVRARGLYGLSYRKLAAVFDCSKSTAHRLCRKFMDFVVQAESEVKRNTN